MSYEEDAASLRWHELNNLFGKIIGAAELALTHTSAPELRAELERIISLSEEGGVVVGAAASAARAD